MQSGDYCRVWLALVQLGCWGRGAEIDQTSREVGAPANRTHCLTWGSASGARPFDNGDWFLRDSGPRFDGINSERALRLTGERIEIAPFVEAGKVYTAAVRISDRFSLDYGTLAVEAKICVDERIRSAVWLQSPRNRSVPDLLVPDIGAEIDVIEVLGARYAAQNLHMGGYGEAHRVSGTRVALETPCEWHEYRVELNQANYRYFIDRVLTWQARRNPRKQQGAMQYTILSCEYGPNKNSRMATLGMVPDTALGTFEIRSVTLCEAKL